MSSYVLRMDPLEIEKRFSNKDQIIFEDSDLTYESFLPYLDKIPKKEKDLIYLYYFERKKQKEIARIYSVTQGAISHRLSRANKRLKFLRDMPKLEGNIEDFLKGFFSDIEIDIIKYMIETTCQSKTALLINQKYSLTGDKKMTQIKVRHRFFSSIEKLKKLKKKNKKLKVCYDLLKYIKNNLYMLHEVILPHFKKDECIKMTDFC